MVEVASAEMVVVKDVLDTCSGDMVVAGVAEEEQDDAGGRAVIALWVFGLMWPCARYGGCG
jgi:hypothetical protein